MTNWTLFTNNINQDFETIFASEAEWSAKGSSGYDVDGNMWAPDVIWNTSMNKWCMYMSINGDNWYSTICMLTSDSLYGDWTLVGDVTASGNYSGTATFDYEKVTGSSTPDSRYTANRGGNLTYEDNCIDPCVLYDEDGNLWMTYGSWFGGIYMLRLDAETGLRDYSYKYETVENQSDEYMGIKIAGGDNSSGEASYIQHIGDYYYLFITYGGLTATGGYNMRVFRSKDITGEYVDESGDSAKFATAYSNTISGTVGMRLMSYYKWSFMDIAQVAQGHNSVLLDDDGSIYLVYHRRTNDGSEGHEVRVHQMFVNEDGWLVTAPFEYTAADDLSEDGYSVDEVAGNYEVLLQTSAINYGSLEYVEPEYITLNADGTISGDYEGTWELTEGKPYITLVAGGETYHGVCLVQAKEGYTNTMMTFTAVGTSNELALWGYCYDGEALDSEAALITPPAQTVNGTDLDLPSVGTYNTTITWASSNPAVIATDGTVTEPQEDTYVTLTATITSSDGKSANYEYIVKVIGSDSIDEDGTITVWHTDETYDLTNAQQGTYSFINYFNNTIGTAGLELYGGAEIECTVELTGDYQVLGTIWGFNTGNNSGNLFYLCGSSYLGYNATGGYFDANLNNYATGVDYIGKNKEVTIKVVILPSTYEVYVDGELAYDMASVDAGTTYGTNSMTSSIYAVLQYLSGTATEFDLGWGSWWWDNYNNSFQGTVKDITFRALAEDPVDTTPYVYYANYSNAGGEITDWISPNDQDSLVIANDGDDYGNYVQYAANSGVSGNRGAYNVLPEDAQISGLYTVSVDTKLTAGILTQRSESQFVITGTDASGSTSNNGVTDGYILKLQNDPPEGTAANQPDSSQQTIWYINDTDETVTIPVNTWVNILAQVDADAGKVNITITNKQTRDVLYTGWQEINGDGQLMGFYLLRGRGAGTASVDNVKVAEGITVGTLDRTATPEYYQWNELAGSFGLDVSEDFTVSWTFTNYNPNAGNNYQNFAIDVTEDTSSGKVWTSADDWFLRADAFSNTIFDGSSMEYSIDWDWEKGDYVGFMNGATVDATLERNGSTMTFTAVIEGSDGNTYHYTATASDASIAEDLTVYLTCETAYLVITDYSVEDGIHHYESEVVEATCTEDGGTVYTCIYCGDTYTDDVVDALGHDWDDGVVTEATCTDDGYTTYTCNRCGETYVVDGETALGHDYEVTDSKEATCTEDGYTTYTCSRCGDSYTETIDAFGHEYEVTDSADATCTEDGYIEYTCSRCGDTYTETIAALGHDYVGTVTTEPTCTEEGEMTYVCSRCEDTYTETIAALGHSYGEPEFTWNDDDTVTATFICSVCGDVLTVDAEITVTVEDDVYTYVATATADGENYYTSIRMIISMGTDEDGNETRLFIESGISEVPEGLLDLYNTVEEIEDELSQIIVEAEGTVDGTAYYDIEFQISDDGGLTWENATPTTFPANGLTITLPYPDGTNGDDYTFVVAHMFTEYVNGHTPGEIEMPPVTVSDAGLTFTVDGLSPIAISWTKIVTEEPEEPTPSEPTEEEPTEEEPTEGESEVTEEPSEEASEVASEEGTGYESPQTADASVWFLIVLAIAGCGIVVVARKRMHA